MARLNLALLVIVFVLIYQVPSMQSRKLFNGEMKAAVISPKDNLVPSDVPKKPTTDKDSIIADNERLFSVHLGKIDQLLQSAVPSPGAGH
ncbi:hypothetical protein ES319_D01G046800v1 [Gossypium barbadense]|uniref:Precursor of CEP14 n=3 Tax=Gossypium TaxID=3633 RepID=A0A5J5SNJ1_GOSBA|nr:hypothetical protein ES319_D01G046800v1 [Gossypium barbadense]PPD69937.1 hypothetical protein GOBAR_DD33184 [Gossypium barbadense]TYG82038.1 hypothetical protein ES288_D01G054500v1 [Gossypium darwinii]TYH86561.1 hypothetical protein ES332_D01G052100v1 [Gossypium tomentosum]